MLSTGEGIVILALTAAMAVTACIFVALIENSQYGEEDTFYESR
jgi:hypothetical protein